MTSTSRIREIGARVGSLVDSRHTIAIAALAAFVLRLPGLARPIYADEAGFLLVARSWDPQPDSMYGAYWVDRPPALIAVVKLSDALGGPLFLRIIGALACAVLVVLAARVALLVADQHAASWTAILVAAVMTNAMIDPVAVKGEILGLPFVMGSFWLTLLALRRISAPLAFAAGLLATTALGLKQNLAAGLVFGGVLLVASFATGSLSRRKLLGLGTAAAAGAAVPVLATVAWALAAGVHLHTLWYAVFGFRSDASSVIAMDGSSALQTRAVVLVVVAFATGLAFVIGGFLVHLPAEWKADKVLALGTLAVLVVDGVGLAAGGSYWRDYLFPLVPGAALCVAQLARHATGLGRAMRAVVVGTAVSSVVAIVIWAAPVLASHGATAEVQTGRAIAGVAAPGDTAVIYGGHAEIQFATGLPSPYPYLWSLPMRTLDPRLSLLESLLAGPNAPTWFVESVPISSWDAQRGLGLQRVVEARYVEHGSGCGDWPVYLLKGVSRPDLRPSCP